MNRLRFVMVRFWLCLVKVSVRLNGCVWKRLNVIVCWRLSVRKRCVFRNCRCRCGRLLRLIRLSVMGRLNIVLMMVL